MAENKISVSGTVKYCDICKERGVSDASIKGKTMYDAPIGSSYGSWAWMCRNCYNTYAFKGVGQMYRKQDDGSWVKEKDLSKTKKKSSSFDSMIAGLYL